MKKPKAEAITPLIFKNPQDVVKESELHSKDDVLWSLKQHIQHIEYADECDEPDFMGIQGEKVVELIKIFSEKIVNSHLPDLTEWDRFYKYIFNGDSIELGICTCEQYKINRHKNYVEEIEYTFSPLITVKCDYISIEKYSKIIDETEETILDWIHRGKLRHIKKKGDNWAIPILQERPPAEYDIVQYTWSELPEAILLDYPMLSLYNSLDILLNTNKSKYDCIARNWQNNTYLNFVLTQDEVEKLEYTLIISGKVVIDDNSPKFNPTICAN